VTPIESLRVADHAPRALNFFRACGIPFEVVRALRDHWYGRAEGSLPHGRMLETARFNDRCWVHGARGCAYPTGGLAFLPEQPGRAPRATQCVLPSALLERAVHKTSFVSEWDSSLIFYIN